jgi:phosphopantothenoylcysteine decarboxylase/phosphopantothenate--cysteine ligase
MKKPERLILGICGGIAAYKAPALIRILQAQGVEVKVVLTPAAQPLVGEETLRTLSGNPVFKDGGISHFDMDHIRLAQWADLFLICPATANTIAKIAHGIADNLLTTLSLSCRGPLMLAPAMNSVMWNNPATRDNLETCARRGIRVLPVGHGALACGDEGPGRMLAPEAIAEYVFGAGLPQCFTGKKILISSGPTIEPIDPVRVLTNLSSGAMGAALAQAAICMGAEVTVVSGPAQVALPPAATVISVETSAEMAKAVQSCFDTTDICIMAAAVSDFRPAEPSPSKVPRTETGGLRLELISNPDILAGLGARKNGRFLAGFSLETEPGNERARRKMIAKGCDLMIMNRPQDALGVPTTRFTLLAPESEPEEFPQMDKRRAGQNILVSIARRMGLTHE